MDRKKIIFIPGWQGESIAQYNVRMARQTIKGDGVWKSIELTTNPLDADLAVCLDNLYSINLANKCGFTENKIIFIKRESDMTHPVIKRSFASSHQGEGYFCPAVWWLSLSFEELLKLPIPHKQKRVSAIVSSQNLLPLHKERIKFIDNLSKVANVDVYGKGHDSGSFNSCYKGMLHNKIFNRCKYAGLQSYLYSIAIENNRQMGYFTEKIIDVILSYSIPIYYGAPDISMYFPSSSIQELPSLNDFSLYNTLEIIREDPSESQIEALSYARETILFRYNIVNLIHKLSMNQ